MNKAIKIRIIGPALFILVLFASFFSIGTLTSYAFTCADGSEVPDSQADNCPQTTEVFIGCAGGSIVVKDNSPTGVAVNCTNNGKITNQKPTFNNQLTDTRYIKVSCSGDSLPTSGPFDDAIFIVCPEGQSTSLESVIDPSLSTGSDLSGLKTDTNCDSDVLNKENCGIVKILVDGINILSALAGMVIIGSIIIAGYQYMTARDNSGQIQQARTRIIWAISAMILFIFMYALLNFLVPGGVL